MAKHFIFENTSQYESLKPSLFACQNRSPSFQEIGYDDRSIDLESENWQMKHKIKELEDTSIEIVVSGEDDSFVIIVVDIILVVSSVIIWVENVSVVDK